MFVGTNSAHPLRFSTNRFVNATSLTIETSGAVVCNTTFTNNSDGRLKDNQTEASLSEMMAIFDAVDVKTYERNDLAGQPRVGFIAQELEAALTGNFTHIVGQGTRRSTSTMAGAEASEAPEEPEETFKTVDYARLTAILWGVCKTLQQRIGALEAAGA